MRIYSDCHPYHNIMKTLASTEFHAVSSKGLSKGSKKIEGTLKTTNPCLSRVNSISVLSLSKP